MIKFVAGHMTKMWFLNLWIIPLSEQKFCTYKLQGNRWKDVVLFSAHLSIAIKRLTINIQAKRSFGCHVGGQEYVLQHGSQYKSYLYFVEKSKCHKISPLNAFPLKFRVSDNFHALSWKLLPLFTVNLTSIKRSPLLSGCGHPC